MVMRSVHESSFRYILSCSSETSSPVRSVDPKDHLGLYIRSKTRTVRYIHQYRTNFRLPMYSTSSPDLSRAEKTNARGAIAADASPMRERPCRKEKGNDASISTPAQEGMYKFALLFPRLGLAIRSTSSQHSARNTSKRAFDVSHVGRLTHIPQIRILGDVS